MKKIFAVMLALAMLLSFAACGKTAAQPTTTPAATVKNVEGTMEELLNKIVEIQPVEFMGGTMPIDLTDKSEDGLWNIKYNTGLDNAGATLFHLEMWAYVHGIATMFATGYLDLDWELVSKMLTDSYLGLRKQYGME